MLKVIELFAGKGDITQSLKNIGIQHEVVAVSEIDKHAIKSYQALHGSALQLGDICKIKKLPYADLWAYSFPCQDISLAGNQKGFKKGSNTRSSLLWQVERLLKVAQANNILPKYLLLENVKNLVSEKNINDFEKWIDFLKSLGYMNIWQVLNAKDYGIPQNRERVFMVSELGGRGFIFPPKIKLKSRLRDFLENIVDKKYFLSDQMIKGFIKRDIAKTIRVGGRGSQYNKYNWDIVKVIGNIDYYGYEQSDRIYSDEGIAPTLTAIAGGGQVPKIMTIGEVTLNSQAGKVYDPNGLCPALCAGNHGYAMGYIRDPQIISRSHGFNKGGSKKICPSITSSVGFSANNPVAYGLYLNDSERFHKAPLEEISRCIKAEKHDAGIIYGEVFRRMTPRECWRLFGWTDEQFDKVRDINSDTQLYKQAGNGIVLPVLEAIFKRLLIDSKQVFFEQDFGQLMLAVI